MHTARQLQESMFRISIGGRSATRAELFTEWGPHHRLAVVVHEDFGTIGASYLLQLAITAFYDCKPGRRDPSATLYPDVFVVHVGGRFGAHDSFDVYPERKEVFVDNDPRLILEAINDRGITHLVVPDRAPEPVQHGWKEPAHALDKICAAWAYSPSGRTRDADVAITASDGRADSNPRAVLDEQWGHERREQDRAAAADFRLPQDEVIVFGSPRDAEVATDVRERILAARAQLRSAEGPTETYRRIAVRDALGMLHCGPAPAFTQSPDIDELMRYLDGASAADSQQA